MYLPSPQKILHVVSNATLLVVALGFSGTNHQEIHYTLYVYHVPGYI